MTLRNLSSAIILAALASAASSVAAQTFISVKDPECRNWAAGNWQVGEQYVDTNNNMLDDNYTLLTRWQGDDMASNWVTTPIGSYTGLTTANQKGRATGSGAPGTQLNCYDVGMFINTWDTPHRPIVGGSYNDMFGYKWSQWAQIKPFVDRNGPSDLVLQANIAVPEFLYHFGSNPLYRSNGQRRTPAAQVCMYAYLRDTTHPTTLHPVVVLACTHDSNDPEWQVGSAGAVGKDYGDYDTLSARTNNPEWFATNQTGNGVWFSAGYVGRTTPYLTAASPASGSSGFTGQLAQVFDTNQPAPFYRVHITPTNLTKFIKAIKDYACDIPTQCPARAGQDIYGNITGYSEAPGDYMLESAGVILEASPLDNVSTPTLRSAAYDLGPANWIVGDGNKNQISVAARVHAFGVYKAVW